MKILVSSVVYDYKDLLDSIYALLDGYGYDVVMSHKGTLEVDPTVSAMESCIQGVDNCDLFLGLILPEYGSGKETKEGMSITHREILRAIEINKPRWFLVHEHVTIARELLKPYRDPTNKAEFNLAAFAQKSIEFTSTAILSDLRVLDMYEAAIRSDVKSVKDRTGNWVQPFGRDEDARLFTVAQFRRYRELLEDHLPKLKDTIGIEAKVRGKK